MDALSLVPVVCSCTQRQQISSYLLYWDEIITEAIKKCTYYKKCSSKGNNKNKHVKKNKAFDIPLHEFLSTEPINVNIMYCV